MAAAMNKSHKRLDTQGQSALAIQNQIRKKLMANMRLHRFNLAERLMFESKVLAESVPNRSSLSPWKEFLSVLTERDHCFTSFGLTVSGALCFSPVGLLGTFHQSDVDLRFPADFTEVLKQRGKRSSLLMVLFSCRLHCVDA